MPPPSPTMHAAVVALPQPTPRPVKPQRPELSEPAEPKGPSLGRAEQTGHLASIAGYVLSVGVGAFGQIMFFGEWLEAMIPTPGNWVAAAIGAAFAEIGMIGAGNSSLTKRRDGGTWKLLFAVACFVCAGAVTMQVAHWMPKGFGVALVFGLASFVGFLIHMVIEHSKIRDFEDRKAVYAKELAAYQAEQHARYEHDLAEYNAAVASQRERAEADRKRADRAQQPGPAETTRDLSYGTPSARPVEPKPKKAHSQRKPDNERKVLDKDTAYAWSKAHGHPGPTAVKKYFDGKGYETRSISTLRDWINGRQS